MSQVAEQPKSDSRELVTLLRRLWGRKSPASQPGVEIRPGCAFGVMVAQRLKDVERHLADMRGRLNWLFYVVIGAVITELLLRLVR